jgi:uncharacterized membrane protein YhhN
MPNRYAFSRRILIGLFFSCIGDGLLVWREFFLYGMVSFGIGHMFFISAFGFQPLNLSLGIPMYIASMLGNRFIVFNNRVYYDTAQLLHLVPGLLWLRNSVNKTVDIMRFFSGLSVWLPQQTLIYKITVPIYTALLVTMAWRAAARVRFFEVNSTKKTFSSF